MAEEGKGVAMAILGIVAVIAVVGLVLLFTGAAGKVVMDPGVARLYTRQSQIAVAAGPANLENPYYGYQYETYGGVTQSDVATGKRIATGGAWDASNVHGETPYDAATSPGVNAAPNIIETTQAPTVDRNPSHIPSTMTNVCDSCPYGSVCIPSQRSVPTTAEPVSGYPGCYVITG